MNDFELKITQGVIKTNLDTLKNELTEIADKYKDLVIQEKDIKLAKSDLANLRKIRKSVDDRRKEVKREWSKPYEVFEKEVKEAIEIIDKPIEQIDEKLKEFENQAKAEKEQHCRELFDKNIGDCAEYVEFSDVFKDTWLNKSTSDNEILSDISGARVKVHSDLEAIKALDSEFEAEVIEYYKKTKQLSDAIQRNSQLISAKQLAEKKAEEEAQAKIEAERKAREEAEKRAEEAEKKIEEVKEEPIEPLPFDYLATFTIRIHDEVMKEELETFLRLNEITDYSIV